MDGLHKRGLIKRSLCVVTESLVKYASEFSGDTKPAHGAKNVGAGVH